MSDKIQRARSSPKGAEGGIRGAGRGQIVSTWGGRQREGLAASEALRAGSVSADHLRGRVCVQTDDGEGEALSEIRLTRLSPTGAEAVKGAAGRGTRIRRGCDSAGCTRPRVEGVEG